MADRASMANSLEVRVPILARRFIQWTDHLPAEFKLNGREEKYILKRTM